jgi:hypothetical protein
MRSILMMSVSLALLASIPQAHAKPAMVADISGVPRIVDGDTVQIDATKIRLSGIDAPETDQVCLDPAGAKWACGVTARDELIKHGGILEGVPISTITETLAGSARRALAVKPSFDHFVMNASKSACDNFLCIVLARKIVWRENRYSADGLLRAEIKSPAVVMTSTRLTSFKAQ